jgi:hypothetical protein
MSLPLEDRSGADQGDEVGCLDEVGSMRFVAQMDPALSREDIPGVTKVIPGP